MTHIWFLITERAQFNDLLMDLFYSSVTWLSCENGHFVPPLQHSGILCKYTSMTFNILALITINVYFSLKENISKNQD